MSCIPEGVAGSPSGPSPLERRLTHRGAITGPVPNLRTMLAGAEAAPPEGLGPLQPTPPIGSPRVPGCYARPGTHIMLQPCPVPANQMVQEHLSSFSAMGAGSDSPKPSALPSLKLGGQPPKGTLDSYTSRPTTAAQSATSSGTPTPASMSGSAVTSSIGGGSGSGSSAGSSSGGGASFAPASNMAAKIMLCAREMIQAEKEVAGSPRLSACRPTTASQGGTPRRLGAINGGGGPGSAAAGTGPAAPALAVVAQLAAAAVAGSPAHHASAFSPARRGGSISAFNDVCKRPSVSLHSPRLDMCRDEEEKKAEVEDRDEGALCSRRGQLEVPCNSHHLLCTRSGISIMCDQ